MKISLNDYQEAATKHKPTTLSFSFMDINEFVKNFCEQFEDTDPSLIKAETKFREELEEWDSLTAMSVIAMADSEYGVTLTGDDIRNSKTVEDLFTLVKSKK